MATGLLACIPDTAAAEEPPRAWLGNGTTRYDAAVTVVIGLGSGRIAVGEIDGFSSVGIDTTCRVISVI